MTDNVGIAYEIFTESIYENIYQLEKEINKIDDKKFLLGLLFEFIRPNFNYNVDKTYINNLIDKIDNNIDNQFDASDYYIGCLNEDVRTVMNDFLWNNPENIDLSEHEELIQWIQQLSKDEIKILEDFYIKDEMYEVISFIMKIYDEK